jgi:anti-sigma factor RsiW
MISEDLEFQISQYVDGSLPVEHRAVVEEAVRSNAAAHKALRDYQKIDLHIGSMRKEHAIHWHRLAEHLSDVVHRDLRAAENAVAGRIFPVLSSWRFRSAVAAMVIFAVGGTLWIAGHHSAPITGSASLPESTAVVTGPQADVANGPAVSDISVGPSPALAQHLGSWRYADGVVMPGPSKVTITAGITPKPHPDPHLR